MRFLQIHRDVLKPGSEGEYRHVEEEIARHCRELGCPHPYLAAESLTGPEEVWYFNEFLSEADREQVTAAYERNAPLMAALSRSGERRAPLVLEAINAFATYRPDLSRGVLWSLGQGRFLSITATRSERLPEGTVFETEEGTRFVVMPAESEPEASEPETRIFAVRPSLSMPAKEWIDADPALWA